LLTGLSFVGYAMPEIAHGFNDLWFVKNFRMGFKICLWSLKPQRRNFMSRKISLGLFFTVLFGLVATTSVFASIPPQGRWASGGNGVIHLLYFPEGWHITIFSGTNRVGHVVATSYNLSQIGGYYIRFTMNNRRFVLRYLHGTLEILDGWQTLPAGTGGRFRIDEHWQPGFVPQH